MKLSFDGISPSLPFSWRLEACIPPSNALIKGHTPLQKLWPSAIDLIIEPQIQYRHRIPDSQTSRTTQRMFVQRELERQYHNAPSAAKCLQELAKTDMRAFDYCFGAIGSLILIMEALKKVLGWHSLPISDISDDAADLLLLTNYFLRWPLKKAQDYYEVLVERNSGDATIRPMRDRQTQYKKKWSKLAKLIRQNEVKLRSLTSISSIREKLLSSEDENDSDVAGIPSLGAVELLLRVVAEARESEMICDVYDKFQDFILSDPKTSDMGIPRVAAICTYTPLEQHQNEGRPCHIITTTADCWDGFAAISKFVKNARKSRTGAEPFIRHVEDIDHIEKRSKTLHEDYSSSGWRQRKNPAFLSEKQTFIHKEFVVRPLKVPSLKLMPRCLRCQALFKFCTDPELSQLEDAYNKTGEGVVNVNLTCAEVYAHFYCKSLLRTRTEVDKSLPQRDTMLFDRGQTKCDKVRRNSG